MKVMKYYLTPDMAPIAMPRGAQLLTVQEQQGEACLWALVDSTQPDVLRKIGIYGTGHEIKREGGKYFATFQMMSGQLVFHVFDYGEEATP